MSLSSRPPGNAVSAPFFFFGKERPFPGPRRMMGADTRGNAPSHWAGRLKPRSSACAHMFVALS
eukprot:8358711-Pyramimonas_sp.AAC.1